MFSVNTQFVEEEIWLGRFRPEEESGYEVGIYVYHQFYIYQVPFVVVKDGVWDR